MRKVISAGAAAVVASVLFLGSIPVGAAQIFIQQSGTSPAGGDPNLISNLGAFNVGVAGTSKSLQDPLLVIVGVYDGIGTPSISYSGGVSTPSLGTYGLTADTATFTASPGETAFSQLGLSAGGSENWTNWSGADVSHGLMAPSSFALYAFGLDTSLSGSSPITIDESGASLGSFIIAYDCLKGTGSSSGCATSGDIAQTVFTNTGMIAATPEPTSLVLFGGGLLSLFLVRRFRLG